MVPGKTPRLKKIFQHRFGPVFLMGFLITGVNGVEVKTIEDLKKALTYTQGIIRLEGIYPGYEGNFTYPLNMNSAPENNGSDQ